MKKLLNLNGIIIVFVLLVLEAVPASAQYSSPYNSNGNVKSISERAYDNQRNNERKVEAERYNRVSTTPDRPTSVYGQTRIPTSSAPSESPTRVIYDKIADADVQGNRIVTLNGKKGVISRNETVLIPVIYEWISRSRLGYYQAVLNKKIENIILK